MTKKNAFIALSLSLLSSLTIPSLAYGQSVTSPVLLSQQSSDSTLQVIRSEDGRFSVKMPGTPQGNSSTIRVTGTNLTWTISQVKDGESVYAVAYTDLPLQVLTMGRQAVMESLKSRPLFNGFDWRALANRGRQVNLDNIPGMEFLNLQQGKVSAIRFYLANRRLYAVMASSDNLHQVNQFISSFSIDSLWRPFTHEQGRFRVNLPMAPVFTPQQLDYQGQTLDWWQFTGHNLMAKEDFYGIAYTDLPEEIKSNDADTVLSGVAKMVLTSLDAEALAQQSSPISLDGYPGKEYLVTTEKGQSYVLRFYLVNDRLYGLLATSKSLENLDLFLNSFEVE